MLWLGALIVFIALQPGVIFAFPPIKNGTVTITTIVMHALFFGAAIALLNQYSESKKSIEGFTASKDCINLPRDTPSNIALYKGCCSKINRTTTAGAADYEACMNVVCTVDTTNNGAMLYAICMENLPGDSMATILNQTKTLQTQLQSLKPDDPFYKTYSKAWNILNPAAALATPQGFTDYETKEGFQTWYAKGPSKMAAGATMGATFGAMGIIGCFQAQIGCGIANGINNGNQDCSIQGTNPQYPSSQVNPGDRPLKLV